MSCENLPLIRIAFPLVTIILKRKKHTTLSRHLRTGIAQHIHPAVVDCVLLAAGRNHSAHFARRAIAGQVRALHHDSGHVQVSSDRELAHRRHHPPTRICV